jgi:outer membrane protein
MRRLAIMLLMLAAFPAVTLAKNPTAAPRRISLNEAIAIALRNNRTMQAARFGSEAARDQIGVARGAILPHLDAAENYSYTDNPVLAFSDLLLQQDFSQKNFALSQLNHPAFLSNFQSQVILSFPVFAGGRLIAAYRAVGFAADAAQWNAIQARQRVELNVVESYYGALLAEQRVSVLDHALIAARAHLQQARDLFEHGMVVNSDVLRTRVLVGTLEQQRLEAQSRLEIAWAELAHALGDEDERLAPVEGPGDSQSDARLAQLETMVDRALANRPEIKASYSRVKEAEQAVIIARADYLPRVDISGVYENDSERLLRAGNNGALFVTGRLNIFNGGATRSKLDAARAQLRLAQALAKDLRHSVALEVETAYRALGAARQEIEVARRNTAYAERALRILDDRYSSGLATNIEVLDAQTTHEEADMRLVNAQVGVAIERAALNLASGIEPQADLRN